jgi:L-galactose dehydrogenase
VNETIPALVALKKAALVRHIGITGLPIKLYPLVLSRLPPGTIDVCLSYCHYCLNDRSLISILPQLEKHNVGVINASCLSMGLLTACGPPKWHPAPQELKDAAALAAKVASEQGQDLSELALMWAVQVCSYDTLCMPSHVHEIVLMCSFVLFVP